MASLLLASDLRVDVGGEPAFAGLSLATSGERVLVLGAARALFEAAAGLRPVTVGRLEVEGLSPGDAARGGHVACAPLDPPLPARWTVREYVTWSARLAGQAWGRTPQLVEGALDRAQLTGSAGTRLGTAGLTLRRATVLAAALATGAPALLLEDPLSGLADEVARPLARVVARALGDGRALVFAGRMPLESPVGLAADEALVIDGGEVVGQGDPAELASASRTVALRVQGDVAAFAAAVEAGGGQASVTPGARSPAYVRVELGPLAAAELLAMATSCHAAVLELRPLSRSFA